MRSEKKYLIVSLLALPLLATAVQAQITANEVEVMTGFEPKVADVKKINDQPVILDTQKVNQQFTYPITSQEITVQYTPDTLSPARMKSEPLAKLHRVYLKAGFGNYLTPYVEVMVNSLRHKKDAYVFRYKHLSSQGNISKHGFPGMSDNEGYANYSHIFKNHTLTLDGEYRRNVVHYYGYDKEIDTLVREDSTRQRFSRINLSADFFSTYRTDSVNWNHSVDLDFYHMTDLYGTMENYLSIHGNVNKFSNLFASEFLGGDFTFQYYNYHNDTISSNNGFFFNLKPYIQLGRSKWNLKAGIDLAVATDDSTKFNVYPDIHFRWNIYRKYVMFYADITGKYERNSFLRLSQQNPFVMSTVRLTNMNEFIKLKGGLKGAFTDNLSYNAGVAFSIVDNMPFFVNDTANFQRRGFQAVYDRTNWFQVFGELSFILGEKLFVTAKANYNLYSPSNLPENWHRPYVDGTIAARYNLGDKLIFTADFYFIGPQQARIFVNDPLNPGQKIAQSKTLDGCVDLNLGAEYRLTKMLSFWVNVNNFAAWRYNRWYGYPTQQFNIIGGLTFAL